MPKGTMLDRLAGAMKTLSKREGKSMTPRQRVAAAQRWNSLADIGEDEAGRLYRLAEVNATQPGVPNKDDLGEWGDFNNALSEMGIREHGVGFRADNPFHIDWMGEPYQYEAHLKNYRPLTDAQYKRLRDNGIGGGYISIEDYAYANNIDPDELLEAMQRRMYNSGLNRNSRIWIDNYKNIVPTEQYRGRLMTPSVRNAIEQRKGELWNEYFEAEDPAQGIGWSEEKAEAMDKEFEERARWDVLYPERRGWRY